MTALISLSFVFLIACLSPSSSVRVCMNGWSTDKDAGAAADDASLGTPCSHTAPIATQCLSSVNAVCVLSYKTFSYRCCGDVTPDLMLGLKGTAKPKCPNGAVAYGVNTVVTCDPVHSPCIAGYTCTKAVNIDPKDPDAAGKAGHNPYLCCMTSSLNGHSAQGFISSGLVPNIVPTAPLSVIDTVSLTTANHLIGLGDDWSGFGIAELGGVPKAINLLQNQIDKMFYHVLIFDATTNKDVIYFGVNIVGAVANLKALALPAASDKPPSNVPKLAFVYYNPAAMTTNKYNYFATYKAPTQNTSPHRFVALVWQTTTELQLAPPDDKGVLPVSPLINLNAEDNRDSDFVPVGTGAFGGAGKSGVFTTVTAFLKGKGKQLGTPIVGTYFYLTK